MFGFRRIIMLYYTLADYKRQDSCPQQPGKDDSGCNLGSTLFLYKKIKISRIYYYKIEGDVYSETIVSGGGGGGSSVGGAIVGGLIAGEAGAIIASRKGVNPITSQTVLHDNRTVALYYYPDAESKKLEKLTLSKGAYETLFSLLPEKEYSFVLSAKNEKSNANRSVSSAKCPSTKEKLLELEGLLADALITQEEYSQKRSEILANL